MNQQLIWGLILLGLAIPNVIMGIVTEMKKRPSIGKYYECYQCPEQSTQREGK